MNTHTVQSISLRRKAIFFVPLVCMSCLMVVTIFLARGKMSQGRQLRELETRMHELTKSKRDTEAQLATAQSLHMIEQEAKTLGYVPVTTTIAIGHEQPVALNPGH